MTAPETSSATGAEGSQEAQDWTGSRVYRVLMVGIVVFVVVQSLYIAPELWAAIRQAPEPVPGARAKTLLMHGGAILGLLSQLAMPTLPFTGRYDRLRSWISGGLLGCAIVLGVMYMMR